MIHPDMSLRLLNGLARALNSGLVIELRAGALKSSLRALEIKILIAKSALRPTTHNCHLFGVYRDREIGSEIAHENWYELMYDGALMQSLMKPAAKQLAKPAELTAELTAIYTVLMTYTEQLLQSFLQCQRADQRES